MDVRKGVLEGLSLNRRERLWAGGGEGLRSGVRGS
jgi:hypothetical protein